MSTYYIAFLKQHPKGTIRLEFAIATPAGRQEARTIAEQEAATLKGYRFQGSN